MSGIRIAYSEQEDLVIVEIKDDNDTSSYITLNKIEADLIAKTIRKAAKKIKKVEVVQ